MARLKILVSNDDGIDSPGIFSLVHELRKVADVFVVAPDREQSAVGHSLTIYSPLRATPFTREGEMFGYSVNGTPSDCVKLGISSLCPFKPDLVVSGINHGPNTSINILYSGTVSAATEGMLSGIPSMAVSLDSHDYRTETKTAAKVATILAQQVLNLNMPLDTLLNVNVPAVSIDKIKGFKVVHHNKSVWKDKYLQRKDPFGREYFWFSGEYVKSPVDVESDDIALQKNYVTINPIHYNITNHEFKNQIGHLEDLDF